MDNSDNNKITGFSQEDLNIIINGDENNITSISDLNKIGNVVNDQDQVISQITPLILVINISKKG